ncbi:MAG: DUF3417 domain-containing protein, partial [Rikenellaceae bacterium]|nr:DUF3417 domain-containing protein [Rikenellaceae bacterium]
LFGYAAARVIAKFVESVCTPSTRVVAHFHEWLTVSGALYLKTNKPQVGTVFTTHATVLGRALAASGAALYRDLPHINADDSARNLGIVAKHSLEKSAAANVDCFTTVSAVTARECELLLGRKPDFITPNGFDLSISDDSETKQRLKKKLLKVAEFCLGVKFSEQTFIIGTSGRYEMHNKGLDLLLDAVCNVVESGRLARQVLLVVAVPAANRGARQDLVEFLSDKNVNKESGVSRHLTHYLTDESTDPILRKITGSVLDSPTSKLQVLFVPTYLNSADGVFDCSYYELLNIQYFTLYPSYYEPWGYTPMESIASGVPTLSTSLSGFGTWVREQGFSAKSGVTIITRTDDNYADSVAALSAAIVQYSAYSQSEMSRRAQCARQIAELARWSNFVDYYRSAWSRALESVALRNPNFKSHTSDIYFDDMSGNSQTPHWIRVMVERDLPDELAPLEELSRNLWWSWNHQASELFEYIDSHLWHDSDNNPITFLDALNMSRFRELVNDAEFVLKMNRVYADFRNYMDREIDAEGVKIAYFCMEYGVHSSLKIYSGGLGVLAGDYLKEASDKGVNITAIGLLYRYGYFTQRL